MTLVAVLMGSLDSAHGAAVKAAQRALESAGATLLSTIGLAEGEATEHHFTGLAAAAARQALAGALDGMAIDSAVLAAAGREKKLMVADMDSTIIAVECIDELADFAGLKDEVAAITEAAMRGELDFDAALQRRVALLAGMTEETLAECYRARVRLNPGAETLVATMRRRGALCALVSGGFTFFTERIAARLGFDVARANRLEIKDGRLTGRVMPPINNAATKRETLEGLARRHGLSRDQTLALGDGANDILMLQAAGLAVAYHAKPKAAAAADVAIRHGDLTALLYLQGIAKKDFVPFAK